MKLIMRNGEEITLHLNMNMKNEISKLFAVADPGRPRGPCPLPSPGPVKINHKKDGRLRQPYRFHVSLPTSTMPLDPLLAKFCLKLSAAESGCSV